MINTAIVSFLWSNQNVQILRFYLVDKPRVVLARICDCTDALREVVEGAGSRLQPLEELLSIEDKTCIELLATEKRKSFCSLKAERGWLEFCKKFGLDAGEFWNVVDKTVEARLTDSIAMIEALDIAREKYSIDILVLSEDQTCLSRIVTEWAKCHSVPSLQLVHGAGLSECPPLHSDELAAYGQRTVEGFLDCGTSPDRIHLTGNPSWDVYPEIKMNRAKLREKIWKKYDLIPDAPLLVFGTTWSAFLTASCDPDLYEKSIRDFFQTCKILFEDGCPLNIIIKDREPNFSYGNECVAQIAENIGLPSDSYRYTVEDTQSLVVAADCLASVDSNLSIEAMMCGTIAINLVYEFGLRNGPSFSGNSGILNVVPHELYLVMEKILKDASMRENIKKLMEERSYYYNVGNAGGSAEKVACLMTDMVRLRNPLIAERDSLLQEKQRLKIENDSLVQDKLLLTRKIEAVTNSLSWRLTCPLRSRLIRTFRSLIKARLLALQQNLWGPPRRSGRDPSV